MRRQFYRVAFLLLAASQLALPPEVFGSAGNSVDVQVVRSPGSRVRVVLVNRYSVAVDEYVVQCDYVELTGKAASVVHWFDSLNGPPYAVMPEASQIISCPLNTTGAKLLAVVYADGNMSGDPEIVEQIQEKRKLMADDVSQDLAILEAATRNDSTALVTAYNLTAQFSQRAAEHAYNYTSRHSVDVVCATLARRLSASRTRVVSQQMMHEAMLYLQAISARLNK